MANSETIQINLKAVADVSDVTSNVQQIQKVLNQLKLPPELQQKFKKLFDDVEKNANKATQAINNGFKSKSDVSNFTKSMSNLNTLLTQIQTNMGHIDSHVLRDSLTVDPKQIQAVADQITNLKNELQNLSNQAVGKTDYINQLQKMQYTYKSVSKSVLEFNQAISSGDIQLAEKKIAQLTKATDKLKASADGGSGKKEAYVALLKQMREVLDQFDLQKLDEVKNKLQQLQDTERNLQANELKEFANTFNKIKDDGLTSIINGLNKYQVEAEQSAKKTQELGSQIDRFKSRAAYFFGMENAVRLFRRAVRKTLETVKDLDKVMTETAVVTKFDVGDMWSQLPEYTKRANQLGVSTLDAYKSATLYYQQGLNDQ